MNREVRELYEAALALAYWAEKLGYTRSEDFSRLKSAVAAMPAPGPEVAPARHGEGPSGGHATGIYAPKGGGRNG